MFAWKKRSLLSAGVLALGLAVLFTAALCLAAVPLFLGEVLPLERAPETARVLAGIAVFAVVLWVSRARGQPLPAAGIVGGGFVLLAALLCALGGIRSSFGPWLSHLALAVGTGALLGAVMSLRKKGRGRRRTSRRR